MTKRHDSRWSCRVKQGICYTDSTRTHIYNYTIILNTVCFKDMVDLTPSSLESNAAPLVKVTICKNQRSNQSPHIQHNANPAGRYLHPDRRPFAGHCLISRIRAVERIKKKRCFAIFVVIWQSCSKALLNICTVNYFHVSWTPQRMPPLYFLQLAHTSLYENTICKLWKTTAAQKVLSKRICQEQK